jgi:hypothetical protein
VEKANSLIDSEDDSSEPLTGSGALSGTVPSGTLLSAGAGGALSGGARSGGGLSSDMPSAPPRGSASGTHSRQRPVESGVFSGLSSQITGDQLVDSLQSALSAASRGEAGLGSLQRSVRDASRALTSLRHAHESLGDELRVMYRGLNEVMSEKAAVERYAALLTQERDAALDASEEARREAKREREFLLREQDRFIQLLLEEHEAELQQLRRALSGRSSAPPAVIVKTEPTTGFRIGVALEPGSEESAALDDETVFVRPAEERPRAVVPMPPRPSEREAEDAQRASPAPLARLQLAVAASDAPDADGEEPHTERGIGERNSVLDRSLTERGLIETLRSDVPRSEVPELDGEGRSRTYPPPPAVLDLDSLAAEVEGNSERPPPIRRIGSLEPRLHLKPARVPTQLLDTHLLDTLISRTGDEESEDKS